LLNAFRVFAFLAQKKSSNFVGQKREVPVNVSRFGVVGEIRELQPNYNKKPN